jgi:hypothetical protein
MTIFALYCRNLVISNLKDQLEEQSQRIIEIEHELTSKNQQVIVKYYQ